MQFYTFRADLLQQVVASPLFPLAPCAVAVMIWVMGGWNWFLKKKMRKMIKLCFEKNA